MNSLTMGIAACVGSTALIMFAFDRCYSADGTARFVRLFVYGLVAALLVASVGTYSVLGHFKDWQIQKLDSSVNYLLAAEITESRRVVKENPKDLNAQIKLATQYLEGGLYDQSVEALDKSLKLSGPRADLLGMKANAMYYRDGRRITAETQTVIKQALDLNLMEIQTRMLLANDAFLHGRYQQAIDEWEILLDGSVTPDKVRAFKNAIANAKKRLAQKQIN